MKNILNNHIENAYITSNLHWVYMLILLYNMTISFIILLIGRESHDFIVGYCINTIILLIHSISSSVVLIIMLKIKLTFYNYIIAYGLIRYGIQIIMLNGKFSNPTLSWLFDVVLFAYIFIFLATKQKGKINK